MESFIQMMMWLVFPSKLDNTFQLPGKVGYQSKILQMLDKIFVTDVMFFMQHDY